MWCWDPVLVNCAGGPEVVAYYSILAALLSVTRDAWCSDGGGGEFWCGNYGLLISWQEVAQSTTTCSMWDVPVPPVGAVWMINVEAVDQAGNSSMACGVSPPS